MLTLHLVYKILVAKRKKSLKKRDYSQYKNLSGSHNFLVGDGEAWMKVQAKSEKQFRDLRRGETMGKQLPTSEDL